MRSAIQITTASGICAVLDLLAETLKVPRANVQIVHGHTSQRKEVLILGLPADAIEQRLR